MEKRKPVTFSYNQIREEFETIRDDFDAVAKWLKAKRSTGYSNSLLVYITGLSYDNISKRLAASSSRLKREGICYAPVAHVPDDWTDREWLARMVQSHSVAQLSMIVGENKSVVNRVIKKHGLKPSKRPPRHQYDTKEWLTSVGHLTVREQAKLAKVSTYTVNCWRVRHGLAARPPWVDAVKYLVKMYVPLKGASYNVQDEYLKLRFSDGATEYIGLKPKDDIIDINVMYRYSQIDMNQIEVNHKPVISTQYEDHFELQYNPLAVIGVPNTANVIEKMIARHMFLKAYYTRCSCDGFINHPKYVLDTSLARLRTLYNNISLKQKFGRLQTCGFESQCWRILEYYIDFFGLSGAHCSADVATAACMAIPIDRLNTTRLIRRMATYIARSTNPIALAKIWYDLGVSGRVLDLWPHNGTKAIACWLLGLEYCTPPNYVMDMAKDRGFFDYIGLKYSTYDGSRVGLVVAEKASGTGYAERHFRFSDNADYTMIVCTDSELHKIKKQFSVKQAIPIMTAVHPMIDQHNSNIVIL